MVARTTNHETRTTSHESRDLCAIVREPIRAAEIVAALKAPADGAVVVFDGIVRNYSTDPVIPSEALHRTVQGEARNLSSDSSSAADAGSSNETSGRETLFLEYEAYEPMALKKMRAIIAEARAKFTIDRVAILHRLGKLDIGETSVLIAVSSPHRAAAFDACRFAIEALKHTVPIWKKEFFRDGAVWVEGAIPSTKPFSGSGESTS